MNALEEIREKLIKLDSFVQENKNIEKRLPVHNMEALEDYYKKVRDILIERIKFDGLANIPRIIDENKTIIDARTTLIIDSNSREQYALVKMFNRDLSCGAFDDTILKNGIFLPAYRSKYIKYPPEYLFLNPLTGRPNYNIMAIRYLFDKNALSKNEALDRNLRNDLKRHIFKTDELGPSDYELLKEYFRETAPFVLNCLLLDFKEEYIKAKRENTEVSLTTAIVNIGKKDNFVIVLETLYNELLKQGIFKDTIFENAITAVTNANVKCFNPILADPINQCVPLKQCNLKLQLSTEEIEKSSAKHL